MRENCLSGSTSGMWKRSMVRIMRHRLTKGPETARPDLTHRATSRLYHFRCNSDHVRVNDNSPAYGQRIDEHGEAAHPGTLTLWVEGQFEI